MGELVMVAAEYQKRLAERRAGFAVSDAGHERLGNWRLLLVVAALGLGYWRVWWGVAAVMVGIGWIGVQLGVLGKLRERFGRMVEFYELALDRIEGKWIGRGVTGDRYLPEEHLYARDLDLFGRGSLFELICRARTRMGEETLAGWLLGAAPFAVVCARQVAVDEMAAKLDLREDMAVISARGDAQVRAAALAEWGEGGRLLEAPSGWLYCLSALGLLAVGAAAGDLLGFGLDGLRLYYLPVIAVCGVVWNQYRTRAAEVFGGAEAAVHELALLAEVLGRLEAESFVAPGLVALQRDLAVEGLAPSRRIAQLRKLMDLVDSRDHVVLRAVGPFVLYDVHLAIALEGWRARSGGVLRRWVAAVGEFEALSSMGGYRYENPTDVFPEFVAEGIVFEGEGLAHPLMSRAQAVVNDLELGGLLVVSGSNMSGKSTLLRTVGVNAVLAQAGGPVRAARLRMSALAVGASIQTHDSLQANTSRFYAEILRLRDIVNQAAGGPALFLIDEILSGTNSHDRKIGAEAILRGLVDRGAIGLASTHDLALTGIVDELAGRARNVHFEDQLVDGVMVFDYRMREGIVTHSNAVALMRAVGLEV